METIKTGYKASWVIINPQDAAMILKYNDKNRRPKKILIAHFARQMVAGKWVVNGHSIKISESGMLLDGQNRLNAVIASRKPIVTLLVEGLPMNSFSSMDEGSKRTMADTLYVNAVGHDVVIGAVLKIINARRKRVALDSSFNRLSNNDGLVLWEKYKDEISQSVAICQNMRKITQLPMVIYLHLQAKKIDYDAANTFFKLLDSGEFMSKRNPISLLRSKLIENKLLKIKRPKITHNLIAHAWNLYRKNKELSCLKVDPNRIDFIEMK